MVKEDARQDNFLDMIDKLHVMNLNIEGAAILTSMADAIRSALEKGLLLEQIIINQRNNSLENENPNVTIKKKKHKNLVRAEDKDNNVLQSKEKPHIDEQNFQSEFSLEKELDASHSKKVKTSSENTTTTKSTIRVVSPSFLADTRFNSMNQNKLTKETVNFADQLKNSLSDNLIIPNQIQYVKQISQSTDDKISKNNCADSLSQNNVSSSEPVISVHIIPKSETEETVTTPVEQTSLLNSSIASDLNISMAPDNPLPPKEPTQPDYEQPVMPFPIVIKSENRRPEESMPFELTLNTTDYFKQAEASTSVNVMELSQTSEVDSGNVENSKQTNKCMVFINAGKDATENEVLAVFKDLGIEYSRIINKPTHSFGFISFNTEEHLKAALALNRKFIVGGKQMLIRPCNEERNKRKLQSGQNDLSCNQRKRFHHNTSPDAPNTKKINLRQPLKRSDKQLRDNLNERTNPNLNRNDSKCSRSRSFSESFTDFDSSFSSGEPSSPHKDSLPITHKFGDRDGGQMQPHRSVSTESLDGCRRSRDITPKRKSTYYRTLESRSHRGRYQHDDHRCPRRGKIFQKYKSSSSQQKFNNQTKRFNYVKRDQNRFHQK